MRRYQWPALGAVLTMTFGLLAARAAPVVAAAADAPQSLLGVGGLRQVSLSWAEPETSATDPVGFYNIYRSDASLGWVLVDSQVATTYVDSGLTDGTTYSYEVTAVTDVGEGTPATTSGKTWSVAGFPGLAVPTTAANQVQLSWTPPFDNGGTPVIGYNIYRSTVSGDRGTAIASGVTTLSYVDTAVAPNVRYYYRVTALNLVGEGAASLAQSAVLVSQPPVVTISSSPTYVVATHAAIITFTSTDPAGGGLSFGCSLDAAAASPCTTPVAYDGLADGPHTFCVVVTDVVHKTSTAKTAWTVDTVAPTAGMTGPYPFQSALRIDARGESPGVQSDFASVDTRYRTASWNSNFGPYVYPSSWQSTTAFNRATGNPSWQVSLTGGLGRTYCFSTRARDRTGNVSAWSPEKCTTLPLDDRALSRSAGWTTGKGKGYVAGTWTETTKQGARLTLSGAQVRRAAVFFRRCPGCGSVAVFVGGHYWKTVYTASTLTPQPWWLILPARALSTGNVVLKVVSSGKPVYVDGLGISRV